VALEHFTVATFEGLEGETFRVQAPGAGALDLSLVEVEPGDAGGAAPDGARASFSLTFAGPLESILPQAIYEMDHAGIGAFALFLVPIGSQEGSMRYQAVFA
jgi:hypothetical protein